MTFVGGIVSDAGGGEAVFSVTCILVSEMFPAAPVACTTTKLRPGFSGILHENPPLGGETLTWLHANEVTPERASEALPVAVTGELVRTAPSVGLLTVSVGGVSSIFSVTLAVACWLPESVTVPLMI